MRKLKRFASPISIMVLATAGLIAVATAADLTDAEATKTYNELLPDMLERYGKAGDSISAEYSSWKRFNSAPYISGTHGKRYVNNFANDIAAQSYGKYEELTEMPVGSVLAKDSFKITKKGKIKPGPLFLMEKMESGFNADSQDWKYSAIMPNGKVMGVTGGAKSKKVKFCYACHIAMGSKTDSMTFLPKEYRQ